MRKPCLDCGLVTDNSRCPRCARAHNRALSAAGRVRRGPNWGKISSAVRLYWREQGRQCADAADGKCHGAIQTDHIVPGSTVLGFAPRCAYHNAKKGNRANGNTTG